MAAQLERISHLSIIPSVTMRACDSPSPDSPRRRACAGHGGRRSGGRSSPGPPGRRQPDGLPYLRKRRKAEVTMALEPHPSRLRHPQEHQAAGRHAAADPAEKSKTMASPRRRNGRAGQPDAGPLGADIGSFRLHLAAEGKAARTVQGYTGAVRWFAAGYLLRQAGKTSWEQVDAQDIQQWIV